MLRITLFILAAVALAAVILIPLTRSTSSPPGNQATQGTLTGTVLLGPTCPVERIPPDPACADKPYSTDIAIARAGSTNVFAITQSSIAGTFSIALPPGSYTVSAGGTSMLPRCAPVSVTITAASTTTAAISCDTGIR